MHSLAPSTAASYRSAANRYIQFCSQFHLTPLPHCQDNVVWFVTSLALSGVSHSSICSYLSGIWFLQLAHGLPDPCISSFPLLGYVLRGIHRLPAPHPRLPRLPITPEILQMLFTSWSQAPQDKHYDAAMLWAACYTGFFVFLRSGEFTCQSHRVFRPTMLSPQDVSVDSHQNPRVVSIHLCKTKADPFGAGVTIYLGRTDHVSCPVTALLGYLALRGQDPGPLFLFKDGSTLSKARLLSSIRTALAMHGLDTHQLMGHSFRIGAATAAARAGLEDSLIQSLGRWQSSAYLRYIRIPPQTLSSTSRYLLQPISQARPSHPMLILAGGMIMKTLPSLFYFIYLVIHLFIYSFTY